ncbi:MAG: hypothetical protein A3H29_12835 [Acidobacteria bacterium RIFCSPLOWO2_02_FULL_67_21]|nr:MAG: hypothetical protein A3H29_12835 [Acidobacteria bacterium RIFCSPLOWO2_02_FULL_67_21]
MPTWWEQRRDMPSIEERVAYLEGTVGEHNRMFSAIQDGMADLRTAIQDVRAGLTELRTDMNARFNQVDQRFAQIDQRFIWMFGTQLAVLLAVIAALAGAYYR